MNKIQAIRGMNDLLPAQTPLWQYLEATIAEVLSSYGYQEIRFPVLEQTELFKRSIGEVTDIVEKEMYTFADRNGDSLSLRPEGTACCVRACEEHGLLYNQTQRLWYTGPMFRHERPQKGRLRQFHQIGVEAFGMHGPDIDVELLMITRDIWRELGLAELVELQINTLGSSDSRARYREALVAYLVRYREDLDEDSLRRLSTNPLRILDSKNERTREILQDAPVMDDFLEPDVKEHFIHFRSMLDALGISYVVNPHLVRGLDYYNNTVFEWVTSHLGAQGTVCAGGRYDGLVSQLGGKQTPAIGFAMGIERMVLLLEAADNIPAYVHSLLDVYMVVTGDATNEAFILASQLREAIPGLRLLVNCGDGNIKGQMKRADKSGALIAVILGQDEIAASAATIKFLREDRPQQHIRFELLEDFLRATL